MRGFLVRRKMMQSWADVRKQDEARIAQQIPTPGGTSYGIDDMRAAES